MVKLSEFVINTTKYNDFINITAEVEKKVAESGIRNGIVLVVTMHTTTAITTNEALECLQSDMMDLMWKLVEEDAAYSHSRMLHSYGTTAGNPTGHLRSMLTGNHAVFPVWEGRVVRGGAQEIFFCEYDGAQSRRVCVEVLGE